MWKKTSWAIAVPRIVRAATEATVSQPGASSGSCTSASGKSSRPPTSMPPVASTGPGVREAGAAHTSRRCVREGREHDRERPRHGPPAAGKVDAGQHAHADEAQADARPTGSAARARAGESAEPMTNAKIGTVACAIPATLESMCFSPHAMSQNGSAALKHSEHERRAPGRTQLRRRTGDALRHEEEHEQHQPGHERPHATSSRSARGRRRPP